MRLEDRPTEDMSAFRYRIARLMIIYVTVLAWVLISVTIALLPDPQIVGLAVGLGLLSTVFNAVIIRQMGDRMLRVPTARQSPAARAPQGFTISA